MITISIETYEKCFMCNKKDNTVAKIVLHSFKRNDKQTIQLCRRCRRRLKEVIAFDLEGYGDPHS